MADKNTTNNGVINIFDNLKDFKGLSNYQLMRGVMDFGQLKQWDMYETGYAFLKVIKIPKILQVFVDNKTAPYAEMIEAYKRIIEFEFRAMSGIPDITTETYDITNNISSLSIISKTAFDSNVEFSMPYFERSGAPLTKVTELYLRGIKDPKTTYKHYNGLIENGTLEAGLENETFTFLYGVTDNTGLKLERAFLILGAQPTAASFSELYEYTKGEVSNKEINLTFRGYFVTGAIVNEKANKILKYLNTRPSDTSSKNSEYIWKDESEFVYGSSTTDESNSLMTELDLAANGK